MKTIIRSTRFRIGKHTEDTLNSCSYWSREFQPRYSASLRFVFGLFDMLQRHSVARVIAAKVKTEHVVVTNIKVRCTAGQLKSSVTHLYNMVQFYETTSIFFTFAPDEINGCLNLRMALPLKDNFFSLLSMEVFVKQYGIMTIIFKTFPSIKPNCVRF